MKYYIINKKFISNDTFLKIEKLALMNAAINRYVLFKVHYSTTFNQNIYLNLN